MSKLKNWLDIQHIFLFFALSWGIIQLFILPPFQVPDEQTHFLRAWGVSNFQFVCKDMKVMVPENILRMAVEVDPVKVKNKLCFFNDVKKYFKERVSSIEKEVSNHFCAYNPIGYIPQAVGIRFGRILDLSPLHIFYLGRLFNLLTAVFLIFNAIKFAPFGKEIFLFTGLLPMTIHQLASLSCDALTISGLMFFTSQVLSLSQRTYIKYTSLVYLILSSLIFIQIKQ